MAKEDVVYMHDGILVSHKKGEKEIAIFNNRNLEIIRLGEISQTQEHNSCMLSLMCGI